MSKLKRHWIVYGEAGKTIKELTFKEAEKSKLACKFYWEEVESAERYLTYLTTRGK